MTLRAILAAAVMAFGAEPPFHLQILIQDAQSRQAILTFKRGYPSPEACEAERKKLEAYLVVQPRIQLADGSTWTAMATRCSFDGVTA